MAAVFNGKGITDILPNPPGSLVNHDGPDRMAFKIEGDYLVNTVSPLPLAAAIMASKEG